MLLTGVQSTEISCMYRDAAHLLTKYWNKVHVGMVSLILKKCDGTTQQSLALHQWSRQQPPTSVATQVLTLLLATDVGDCCLLHWCRARDCCIVPSHFFNINDTIPTCTLFQYFVSKWAASTSRHAACFCALYTNEQHPYITFFF